MLLLLLACSSPDDTGKIDDTGDSADTADTGDSADTADTTDTGGPDSLAVGDVAEMDATGDGGVTVTLTEAGTYIVILVSTAAGQGTLYGYGDNAGAGAMVTPPEALPEPREEAVPVSMAVAEGDHREFVVYNGSARVTVDALATRVTDELVVWEDQTTPNEVGSIDQETVEGVIESFSTIVTPRERQVFGEESDVNGDGKLDILLSYTVNQYGPVAYVSPCDIGVGTGCSGWSNGSEVIYMGIPDPESGYSSVDGITETFAHEYNHLIYSWHKYAQNDQPDASENIYLTEGMSALAQDLSGYNNGNQYVWASALDGVDVYGDENYSVQGISWNDILRGRGYYDAERDGPLRGAGYLYLRYLFEQAGGMVVNEDGSLYDAGGMAWLHTFFGSPELGEDAVMATTGRELEDIGMDWYTALVVTGRVDNDNPAWNYQPQVEDPLTGYMFGMDPWTTIHGWWQLTGPLVQKLNRPDEEIRAGGVEYLQTSVDAGETITIPVHPDAKARARILRVE